MHQRPPTHLRENAWLFTPYLRYDRPASVSASSFVYSVIYPALLFRSVSDFHSFTHTHTHICVSLLPFSDVFIYRRVRSIPRTLQWSSKYILDNLMLIYVCATAFLITFPCHVRSHDLAWIQSDWIFLSFDTTTTTGVDPKIQAACT